MTKYVLPYSIHISQIVRHTKLGTYFLSSLLSSFLSNVKFNSTQGFFKGQCPCYSHSIYQDSKLFTTLQLWSGQKSRVQCMLQKNTSNWNYGSILMLLLFLLIRFKISINFQKKKSQKMGFKSCCQVYKSIFGLKYYQNFIIH